MQEGLTVDVEPITEDSMQLAKEETGQEDLGHDEVGHGSRGYSLYFVSHAAQEEVGQQGTSATAVRVPGSVWESEL